MFSIRLVLFIGEDVIFVLLIGTCAAYVLKFDDLMLFC